MDIGVPQGSILGPLLFIIYVNDLPNASAFFAYILFADDTNILASERDKKALHDKVTTELGKLSNWFVLNRLSLNYEKTEFISFSKTSKADNEEQLTVGVDGKLIRRVTGTKFLGIHLDESISWRKHIGTLITKISP